MGGAASSASGTPVAMRGRHRRASSMTMRAENERHFLEGSVRGDYIFRVGPTLEAMTFSYPLIDRYKEYFRRIRSKWTK